MTMHDMDILVDVRATPHGIRVHMPDGGIITATHMGLLPNPMLPLEARICYVFPELTSDSLISISRCYVTRDVQPRIRRRR